MDGIAFQKYEEKHLADILDIYSYYVLNSTATWHFHTLDEAEMRALVFSDDDRYGTFVIEKDGGICGYVSVRQYKTREAYRDTAEISIYLRHDACGKGIGRAAVRHIEDFSRNKGFHVLIASISGDNDGSMRLFENTGYIKCAHYREVGKKFGKLLDNVVYQKILN
jgi:phosphinothricin acetyltransferase